MNYRIVESTVERCNGFRCWKERMFMAQRQHSTLWGALKWWWPVINARWATTREQAEDDIADDRYLRQPTRVGHLIKHPRTRER